MYIHAALHEDNWNITLDIADSNFISFVYNN